MPDEQCMNCCRKHLGSAHGYYLEYDSGRYNSHFWKSIGQLALAEAHCILINHRLHKLIENERLKAMESHSYQPDFDMLLDEADAAAFVDKHYVTLATESNQAEIDNALDQLKWYIKETNSFPPYTGHRKVNPAFIKILNDYAVMLNEDRVNINHIEDGVVSVNQYKFEEGTDEHTGTIGGDSEG